MGRCTFPVQQPGVAKDERAETQADDFRAVIPRPHQAIKQRLRRTPIDLAPVRHHHDICLFQRGVIAGGVQRKTIAGAQQPRPLGANVQIKAFDFRD